MRKREKEGERERERVGERERINVKRECSEPKKMVQLPHNILGRRVGATAYITKICGDFLVIISRLRKKGVSALENNENRLRKKGVSALENNENRLRKKGVSALENIGVSALENNEKSTSMVIEENGRTQAAYNPSFTPPERM